MSNKFAKYTVFEPTLTGTYQISGGVDAGESNKVALFIDYTKGTEDAMRLKVEFSDDSNAWFQEIVESVSGGVATVTPVEREFTNDQKVRILLDLSGGHFRVHAKGTGATPTGGTVKVRYKLL